MSSMAAWRITQLWRDLLLYLMESLSGSSWWFLANQLPSKEQKSSQSSSILPRYVILVIKLGFLKDSRCPFTSLRKVIEEIWGSQYKRQLNYYKCLINKITLLSCKKIAFNWQYLEHLISYFSVKWLIYFSSVIHLYLILNWNYFPWSLLKFCMHSPVIQKGQNNWKIVTKHWVNNFFYCRSSFSSRILTPWWRWWEALVIVPFHASKRPILIFLLKLQRYNGLDPNPKWKTHL